MDKKEVMQILEENKITNIHTPSEQMSQQKVTIPTEQPKDDVEKNIKWVLEQKVGPAVAQHNGKIEYISFKDGVLKLLMAGSCSGCAMSKQTLMNGVENMMKHYVPEVKSIVGEDDETAADQGYNPWMPLG